MRKKIEFASHFFDKELDDDFPLFSNVYNLLNRHRRKQQYMK